MCSASVLTTAGSPFQFLVTDSNRVTVRGDGLSLVRAGQSTFFLVTAPPAQLKDMEFSITGACLLRLLVNDGECVSAGSLTANDMELISRCILPYHTKLSTCQCAF